MPAVKTRKAAVVPSAFDRAFEHTLGHEGGYTDDPNDKGNWTGGQIGSGENKGTKFGVSAAAYPTLDIKNLTVEQAKEIYWRDYWLKLRLEQIEDQRLCIKLFDIAVNGGVGRAVQILQLAVNYLLPFNLEIATDGRIGSATVTAVNSLRADRLLAAVCGECYVFYRSLVESEKTHQFEKYAGGWVLRALWMPTA